MNYFSLFGLPVEYQIDIQLLTSRFQNLQRQYHPDKFSGYSRKERLMAVKQSAMINQAWKTLRNPINRAEYLLSLHGFDLTGKCCIVIHDKMFLMEQLALREEVNDIEKTKDKAHFEKCIEHVKKISDFLYQEIEEKLRNQCWERAANIVYKLRFFDKLYRSLEQLEEKILDL